MSVIVKKAKGDKTTLGFALLWLSSYLVARLAIETLEPGSLPSIGMAVLPILPFIGLLWFFIRDIRGADELERRIHLEALALAFPLTMLLLMVLGLLDLTLELNPDDWSYRHLWPFMTTFWLCGLGFARKRYS